MSKRRDYERAREVSLHIHVVEHYGVSRIDMRIFGRTDDREGMELIEEWCKPPTEAWTFGLSTLKEHIQLWLDQLIEERWGDDLELAARLAAAAQGSLELPMD